VERDRIDAAFLAERLRDDLSPAERSVPRYDPDVRDILGLIAKNRRYLVRENVAPVVRPPENRVDLDIPDMRGGIVDKIDFQIDRLPLDSPRDPELRVPSESVSTARRRRGAPPPFPRPSVTGKVRPHERSSGGHHRRTDPDPRSIYARTSACSARYHR
jgi:hypothetical protein